MKIGFIGAGRIGASVGQAWETAGHDVMYGVREGSSRDVSGNTGTIDEAIAYGETILFAIPGRVMAETLAGKNLDGKIILDATNGGDTEVTMAQYLTDTFPNAFVYKAFNTLGFENFQNPNFGDEKADLLFVGNDVKIEVASTLISDAGLNPIYVGDVSNMGVLDAGMRFWFALTT